MKSIKYIGLDVHKKTIAVAIAEDKRNGEVRFYGTIANNMTALKKVIRNKTSFYLLFSGLNQKSYDGLS